jgi:hypothetical protein
VTELPEMGSGEQAAYKAVERLGPVNTLTLYNARISPDAVQLLLSRGIFEPSGGSGVKLASPDKLKEIAQNKSAPVQKTDKPTRDATPRKPRKATYSALVGLWPDRVRQLAGRIIHWVHTNCEHDSEYQPRCSVRALERGLHANRHPEWSEAVSSLIKRKAVAINAGMLTVTDLLVAEKLPDPFDPTGRKAKDDEKRAKRKSRPKRPLSEWVKQKIRERGGIVPGEG